jgi:hypothetical protein
MNLLTPYKSLTIAFIALGISTSVNCVSAANDARRPMLATEQAPLPAQDPTPVTVCVRTIASADR